jgi:hypothetical protein
VNAGDARPENPGTGDIIGNRCGKLRPKPGRAQLAFW